MNKQKGFALIPILITIAILAVVGFVGWRVYEGMRPGGTSSTNIQAKSQASSSSSTQQDKTTSEYLDIKELGVKIKLSDDLKDAVYDVDANSDVRVSTKSLIDQSNGACDPKIGAPFGVLRATNDPTLPDGRTLKPNGANIFQVGSTFITLDLSVNVCADKPDVQSLELAQLQSFKEALKTIQSDK